MSKLFIVIYILLSLSCISVCLELLLQRCNVTYFNPKYVSDAHANIRRYGRRSPYVYNLNFTLLVPAANNFTVQLKFYELLHNEYRPSFVEMNFNLCNMVNKDSLIGPSLIKNGLTCPFLPGEYVLSNITFTSPALEHLPYKWPFENGKVIVTFKTKHEIVGEGFIILIFKQ